MGMERSLHEVFGITNHDVEIPSAGRTDRAITQDLFAHHGIDASPENLQQFLTAYDRHLPTALTECQGEVYPGIYPLIEQLAERTDVVLGLLTGNYQLGAHHKLAHYRLNHHFGFGGFGDVHLHRDDVARSAYQAAQQALSRDINPADIWVIGDTPADVRCARAIGANVAAVATGIFSVGELEAMQPDRLFADFSDYHEFLSLLA